MLVQFNFKNYKSFKNETTLDMTASSIKEHSYNLIETKTGDKYLKVAAIYGANASGKSKLVDAFSFMKYFIFNSLRLEGNENKYKKKNIPVNSFAFDRVSLDEPSEFEVFFIQDDVEYQYGYALDTQKVHAEWLYRRDIKRKEFQVLFQRENETINCNKRVKEMKEAEKFKNSVDNKTLFLTLTAKTQVEVSKEVVKWFSNQFIADFGDTDFERMISRYLSPEILENNIYKNRLEQFLIAIDTGIKGIRVEENKDIKEDDSKTYSVFSKHETAGGDKYTEIHFEDESSGTLKMFCLFDYFWETMKNGGVLFIDELSSKLHPYLLRYIINIFHDPTLNKNNAQLVYTTHDTFTLTKDIFRRDEIWFVEKNNEGISDLYSLVEYKLEDDNKVRNDATFYKDYLGGRYGAVPVLQEFSILED